MVSLHKNSIIETGEGKLLPVLKSKKWTTISERGDGMRLIDADKIIAWIDDWNKGLSKSDDTIRDVLDTVVDELYDAESWEWLTEPEDIPIEGTECLVTIEDEDGETWMTIAEYTGESFIMFTKPQGRMPRLQHSKGDF